MATGNIFLNAQAFYKTLNNVERKLKVLEKKKATVGLDIDEKAEEKYILTAKEYLSLLEKKDKLESKRMSGKATQSDLRAYNDVNEAIDLTNKLLNKQTEQMKSINKITVNQITRLKNLAEEQQVLNKAKRDEAKAIKETEKAEKDAEKAKKESAIKAEKEKRQAIKETERAEKERAKAEEEAEKKATQAREQARKEQESKEKRLIQLKNEQQEIMRKLYDQEYGAKSGKKSRTPQEMAYLKEQLKSVRDEASGLVKELGDVNKAVKNYKNGIAFTERNNPFRLYRDEAEKLKKTIPKLSKDLTALKIDPEGNKNQIAQVEKELSKAENRLKRIMQAFQAGINREQREGMQGAYLSEEDYEWIRKVLPLIQEEVRLEKEKVNKRQEAVNLDKQESQQKKDKEAQELKQYNTIKSELKERFQLEERLNKLQGNPSKHIAEITALKKILAGKKTQKQLENEINKLPKKYREELQKIIEAQKEQSELAKGHNKDLKDGNKSLGQTLKNFMKFTAYYFVLNKMKELVTEMISTMKELDKAFTDIQMVTGDTDEETAKLAKSYNQLAKEMGSTTTEIAEGAGEWLRQGKTTEETTELLRSSMTLAKVGAMESSEATELLTSSLNGYKKEASEAMSIVDKISSIDLAAATSSYELATALSRTANSANDAGVSFDKLLGMIGTTSSVTRKSAETIRRIIQNNICTYV